MATAQSYSGEIDWQCVYPTKKVYFEDNNKLVYCIRIDSTLNDNSILYPFSDLHQIDWDCYSATSGSWLSKYIIINEDGNTIFINGKNQHILIKNRAELNETWEMFTNNTIKVKGKITSISLKSVLGVEDSVKTISFSVYTHNDEPANHVLNDFSIEISKQFGLVKTVNFYYFEHITENYYHFGEFNLIGINEPQTGFQNINFKEQYYDFQVDDELHIWDLQDYYFEHRTEKKIIHRYLSRSDYEDSIVYYCERKIYTETKTLTGGSLIMDTVKQTIVKGVLFNTEPNEIYDNVSKVMIVNNSLPITYMFSYELYKSEDTCLAPVIVDMCITNPTYYPGLGGPYYPYCEFMGAFAYELVYYKKGDTEWGNPFNLSVSELKKDNSFRIYPNPTTGELRIEMSDMRHEILDITVFDIYGRKQIYNLKSQISNLIDISHLHSGIYFVKISTDNGKATKKIIKQ